MPDKLNLEELMIPGHRILVVNDLGPVHKGDHLIMIANVVVSVDTSRRPDDVALRPAVPLQAPSSATMPKRTRRKYRKDHGDLTPQILSVIRDNQPVSSIVISDKLGFERSDTERGRVTRFLKLLLDEQKIKRFSDERTRIYRYELENEASRRVE